MYSSSPGSHQTHASPQAPDLQIVLVYDEQHPEDEHGGMSLLPLDLADFEPYSIDADAFQQEAGRLARRIPVTVAFACQEQRPVRPIASLDWCGWGPGGRRFNPASPS